MTQTYTQLIAEAMEQPLPRVELCQPDESHERAYLAVAACDEQTAADVKDVIVAIGELFATTQELRPLLNMQTPDTGGDGLAAVAALLHSVREQLTEDESDFGALHIRQTLALLRQATRLIIALKRLAVYPSWGDEQSRLTLTQAAIATCNTLPQLREVYRQARVRTHTLDGVEYVVSTIGVGITRAQDEQDDLHAMILFERRTRDSVELAYEFFLPRVIELMLKDVREPDEEAS
jgi:hypothetical protein